MAMNTQGRPTGVADTATAGGEFQTFTGNRGLDHEEPLIFEHGSLEKTGVDMPEPKKVASRLGGLERTGKIGLPGLPEPETMRHYVRLSRKNYAIDSGLYPLGSCTMKHNPRLNEKMARLPGFGDAHPLQPQQSVQGAIALMETLAGYLLELTGMESVALSPKAGAHGELCGMLAIKAAHEAKGSKRDVVLVPESAHGTNPATAAFMGYTVKPIPARDDGTVSVDAVRKALGPDVAAIMLTNPNTCGLFEPEVAEIAKAVHEAGAYFYCDGANFNAFFGKVRPGDLGIDAIACFMGALGFGSRTGIDVAGEAEGVLPSPQWKKKRFRRPEQQKWYAGETISIGIGQGYNSYTPLQLAAAVSTLANDGVMFRPHLVNYVEEVHTKQRTPVEPRPLRTLDWKPGDIATIKRAMVGVNKEGTSARAFAGAQYTSGGKTGTAQVVGLKGEKYVESRVAERFRDHALFIAYAPADNPKIALAVIVENSGFGARAAAPIARQAIDYWLLGKDTKKPVKDDDDAPQY